MKTLAAILNEIGKPLSLEEIDIPPLHDGQVLVRMAFSGVCHSQLMEVRGKRGVDKFLPHLLGHEGSGTVVEIGRKVKKVKEGDQVVLTWIKGIGSDEGGTQFRQGNRVINSGPVATFSTLALVSENRVVKLPDLVSLETGSLFGCAILTGAGIVFNSIKPERGKSLAVWGVGGIGLSALMAAKVCGCSPLIALDVEDSKLALAGDFGATHQINVSQNDPQKALSAIVGNAGLDFAVEAGGRTKTIEMAFESVKKNGGLCIFASHPPTGEKIALDPHSLISGKQIRGSWGGESKPDEDIPRFASSFRKESLPLEKFITHRYSLYEINEALDDLENGKVGRALLDFSMDQPKDSFSS